jgi:hypothetical protein
MRVCKSECMVDTTYEMNSVHCHTCTFTHTHTPAHIHTHIPRGAHGVGFLFIAPRHHNAGHRSPRACGIAQAGVSGAGERAREAQQLA